MALVCRCLIHLGWWAIYSMEQNHFTKFCNLQVLCSIIVVSLCASVTLTTISYQTKHDHCYTEGALNVLGDTLQPTMLCIVIISTIILIITIILNMKIIIRLVMSHHEASSMISPEVLSEREVRDRQVSVLISITSFVYIFLTIPQVNNCQMFLSQRRKSP